MTNNDAIRNTIVSYVTPRIAIWPGLLAALLSLPAVSGQPSAILPPVPEWHGASERLLDNVPPEWRTPAEASNFDTTPDYATTLDFLRRLDAASDLISMTEIGRSAEGWPLMLVIASRETKHDCNSLRRSKRARVLIQAGIHAGEIDGKDAALLLLRDIVTGRKARLLDQATLLFIPVLNPDGHERQSGNRRVNQRGPSNAGWRTTGRNLNLNRDYTKLEAPETRALVQAINRCEPDLYLDLHVTDGMDHQYDVTYGFNEDEAAWSQAGAHWLATRFRPAIDAGLRAAGHVPGPYLSERDGRAPEAEFESGHSLARFSNGYGDLRHLPTVLVENHSLKPYRRRVLGAYVLIEQTLRAAGQDTAALRQAIAQDRARRTDSVPISFVTGSKPAREQEFLAIEHEQFESPISGGREIRWLGRPVTQRLPVYTAAPSLSVRRPAAYWIPPAWADLAAKLRAHGVRVEEVSAATSRRVTFYRLQQPKLTATAFEGRINVSVGGVVPVEIEPRWPAGSFRVSTDQPLGDLAMVLLEPQSEDSYFAWGYLLEILQRTEYVEAYIMEPLARQMLAIDPALRAAWQDALKDPEFAASPDRRLDWFYERSGLADERYLLYPIARE